MKGGEERRRARKGVWAREKELVDEEGCGTAWWRMEIGMRRKERYEQGK